MSNGPYVVEEWLINNKVSLRKNPLYWNAESVDLERVDFLHGDHTNTSFNRYTSGVLDWIDSEGVPFSIVDRLIGRPDMHVGPYLNTYFYRFNVTTAPLTDARVRKALYHAIDPTDIVEHVTRAGQIPAHSLVPPGLPGYTEVQLTGFSPDTAREFLADAGYPSGEGFPELTLLYNTSEAHRKIAEVVQQQWKRHLGIDVKLANQEWMVFMATTRGLDYQIARGGWIGDYLDPNTFLDIWHSDSGNNRTGFASARYDSMILLAARTLEPAARMKLLGQCEAVITEQECIILPVYYYVVTNMYDGEKFGGLEPNLLNFPDLRGVYLKSRRGDEISGLGVKGEGPSGVSVRASDPSTPAGPATAKERPE